MSDWMGWTFAALILAILAVALFLTLRAGPGGIPAKWSENEIRALCQEEIRKSQKP
jgi:hypothetical protein